MEAKSLHEDSCRSGIAKKRGLLDAANPTCQDVPDPNPPAELPIHLQTCDPCWPFPTSATSLSFRPNSASQSANDLTQLAVRYRTPVHFFTMRLSQNCGCPRHPGSTGQSSSIELSIAYLLGASETHFFQGYQTGKN